MGLFLIPALCISGGMDDKKEIPPVKKKTVVRVPPSSKSVSSGQSAAKKKVQFLLGQSVGYDNNVYLDSRRHDDAFFQTFFKATYSNPINKKTKGILSYELMSLLYPDSADANLFKNGIYGGFEDKLTDKVTLYKGIGIDYYDYSAGGSDDFLDYKAKIKLKHALPNKMYHAVRYEFLFRDYSERRIRTITGATSTKKREDTRYTAGYELGKYFKKDLLKGDFQYYYNDSNETYLKYYTYDSVLAGPSWTHLFNDKLFSYMSFLREWRDYRTRTISQNAGFKEWDRTYIITTALYYNLRKDLTLNLNYTYRENWSNEPTSTYSGSLISTGLFYKF